MEKNMETFKYVFNVCDMDVTQIAINSETIVVETREVGIQIERIKRIELIKGSDNNVYRLHAITSDNLNDKNEIRLSFWYENLNKKRTCMP